MNLNVSLICLSLKYVTYKVQSSKLCRYLVKPYKLKTSYKNIVKVSKWFNHELSKYNYNDNKLIRALDKKDYEIIKSIIMFVRDRDILNVYLSKYYHDYDMLKLLIENGADLHKNINVLCLASKKGLYDTVKLLIENGADVNTQNNKPLKIALNYKHFTIAQLLIDNGADIHWDNDEILIWAVCNRRFNTTKFLIHNGVNPNNDLALRLAYHYRIYNLLIDNGAVFV